MIINRDDKLVSLRASGTSHNNHQGQLILPYNLYKANESALSGLKFTALDIGESGYVDVYVSSDIYSVDSYITFGLDPHEDYTLTNKLIEVVGDIIRMSPNKLCKLNDELIRAINNVNKRLRGTFKLSEDVVVEGEKFAKGTQITFTRKKPSQININFEW